MARYSVAPPKVPEPLEASPLLRSVWNFLQPKDPQQAVQGMVNPMGGLAAMFSAMDPQMVKALLSNVLKMPWMGQTGETVVRGGGSLAQTPGLGPMLKDAVVGLAKGRPLPTFMHEAGHVAGATRGIAQQGGPLDTLLAELGGWMSTITQRGSKATQEGFMEAVRRFSTYVGRDPAMSRAAKSLIEAAGEKVPVVGGKLKGQALSKATQEAVGKKMLSMATKDPEKFWAMASNIVSNPAMREYAGMKMSPQDMQTIQAAYNALQKTGALRSGPENLGTMAQQPLVDIYRALFKVK